MPLVKASDFLLQAAKTMEERGKQYDKAGQERSMPRTVLAFNAITGHKLLEADGWLFLQILKDARQWSAPTYHEDSALDGVAYSSLKAEALAQDGPSGDLDLVPPWSGQAASQSGYHIQSQPTSRFDEQGDS